MRLIAFIVAFIVCAPVPALAQWVRPSQLEPNDGFVRRSPCATGNADQCGSDPPTFAITPDMCGTIFSTSAARNENGSVSRKGVRFELPNVQQFLAAGKAPFGATGTAARDMRGRDAQCTLYFVMGLPEENYLRLRVNDGKFGEDRITFLPAGAFHDTFNGEVIFPYMSPGVIAVGWNGVSWLPKSATPSLAEQLHLGQLQSHGRGRLFAVTKDPDWWTAGTRVGSLAYCPHNGLGAIINANGAAQLGLFPVDCAFHSPAAGTATELIGLREIGLVVTGMEAGADYPGGVAPNGEQYDPGKYIVITVGATLNYQSGDTLTLYNLKTQLGSKIMGRWIGRLVSSNKIELHEELLPYEDTLEHVGPPSSYIAGDSLGTTVAGAHGYYWALGNRSLAQGRRTGAASGAEFDAVNGLYTIVGAAHRNLGAYAPAANFLPVASFFNATESQCRATVAIDINAASQTFAQVRGPAPALTVYRCNFVHLNHSSATSISFGDAGDEARWEFSVGASNNTAGAGCEFTVAFDGTAPELTPTVAGFVNPAGVSGGRQTVSAAGARQLADGLHYVTLLARAVGGGTCTVFGGSTALNVFVQQ